MNRTNALILGCIGTFHWLLSWGGAYLFAGEIRFLPDRSLPIHQFIGTTIGYYLGPALALFGFSRFFQLGAEKGNR